MNEKAIPLPYVGTADKWLTECEIVEMELTYIIQQQQQ